MPDKKKLSGHPLLTAAITLALAAAAFVYPSLHRRLQPPPPIVDAPAGVSGWAPLAHTGGAELDLAFVFSEIVASRIDGDPTTLAVMHGNSLEQLQVLRVAPDGVLSPWHEIAAVLPCEHGWFVGDREGRWSGLAQDGTRVAIAALGAPRGACRGDAAEFPQGQPGSAVVVTQATSLRGEALRELPAASSQQRARNAPWPESSGWRMGYRDATGWRLPPRYEDAGELRDGLAVVQLHGVRGVIDVTGRWLTPEPPHGVFERWSLVPLPADAASAAAWAVDREGNAVPAPPSGRDDVALPEGGWAVRREGAWELADAQGRWIEPAPDARIEQPPTQGRAVARSPAGRCGFVDLAGHWAIAPAYAQAEPFKDGLARVSLPERPDVHFTIDLAGRRADAPAAAAPESDLHEGLQRVALNGRWGFADEQGRTVIEPRFDELQPFSHGLAAFREGASWGFVDKAGKVVVAAAYAEVQPFDGQAAWVRPADATARFIDARGEPVAFQEPQPQELRAPSEGRAAARAGERWGFVDAAGHWVVAPQYLEVGDFQGGLASVGSGGAQPAAAADCPVTVDRLLPNGLIALRRCGRYGFMDRSGRLMLPPAGLGEHR